MSAEAKRERHFDTTEVNVRVAAAVGWAMRSGWSREDFDIVVGAQWSAYVAHLEATNGPAPMPEVRP